MRVWGLGFRGPGFKGFCQREYSELRDRECKGQQYSQSSQHLIRLIIPTSTIMAVVLLQVVFLIELKSPGPCNPRASGLKTQKPKQSMVIYCFHVVYLQGIEITS